MEEVHHCGGRVEVSDGQDIVQYLSQLFAACTSCLYHACLYNAMFPTMMIAEWTSETVSKLPLLNVFFIRAALVMVSLYSIETLTDSLGNMVS